MAVARLTSVLVVAGLVATMSVAGLAIRGMMSTTVVGIFCL